MYYDMYLLITSSHIKDAGSDVSNMTSTAYLDGDYYVLNGNKSWVTSGPQGEAAVIFATVDKTLKHNGVYNKWLFTDISSVLPDFLYKL